MNQESAHLFLWSAEKQLRLHASLSGMWAEDSWQLEGIDWKEQPVHRTLCFTFPNNALKEEFKYAVWFQWTQGIWHGYHKQGQQAVLHSLRYLVTWLQETGSALPSFCNVLSSSGNAHYAPGWFKQTTMHCARPGA